MRVITNAVSLGMLPMRVLAGWPEDVVQEARDEGEDLQPCVGILKVVSVNPNDVIQRWGKEFESIVGHADTAALFSNILGVEVPFNRESFDLEDGDELLVGQYIGPRLPEGTKVLPEGAKINWLLVKFSEE